MAVVSAARFTSDQDGMRAINAAVAALADDPEPPEAFVRGSYRRLRIGSYRVMYAVEDDLVTVIRVDRIP
jgi:mRNA interferase RelE/StbE